MGFAPPPIPCQMRNAREDIFPGLPFCHQPVDRCCPVVLREGHTLEAAVYTRTSPRVAPLCQDGPGGDTCTGTGLGVARALGRAWVVAHVTQDGPWGWHVPQDHSLGGTAVPEWALGVARALGRAWGVARVTQDGPQGPIVGGEHEPARWPE